MGHLSNEWIGLSDIFVCFIMRINRFIASSKCIPSLVVPISTLLHINSSVFFTGGQSSLLTGHYAAAWAKKNLTSKVVTRDLAENEIPHLGGAIVGAFFTPADKRSAEQQAAIAVSDELVAEIQAADVILIGAPMYNFSIPSVLKSYFDHIARAGLTFKYTEADPVVQYGPFMMNSREEIEQAIHDYQTGKFIEGQPAA